MPAHIISLLRSAPPRDWSEHELAEFHRVEQGLVQSGLRLEVERGRSDEGDPWLVFCRGDDGEVFIHFARTGGLYVAHGAAFPKAVFSPNFGSLIRNLMDSHTSPRTRIGRETNVFLHPTALLIAVVSLAFYQSGEARAAEPKGVARPSGRAGPGPARLLIRTPMTASAPSDASERQVAAIATGLILSPRNNVMFEPLLTVDAMHDSPVAMTSEAALALAGMAGLGAPIHATAVAMDAHDVVSTTELVFAASTSALPQPPAAKTVHAPGGAPQVYAAPVTHVAAIVATPAPASAHMISLAPHTGSEAIAALDASAAFAHVAPAAVTVVQTLPTDLQNAISAGQHVIEAPAQVMPIGAALSGAPHQDTPDQGLAALATAGSGAQGAAVASIPTNAPSNTGATVHGTSAAPDAVAPPSPPDAPAPSTSPATFTDTSIQATPGAAPGAISTGAAEPGVGAATVSIPADAGAAAATPATLAPVVTPTPPTPAVALPSAGVDSASHVTSAPASTIVDPPTPTSPTAPASSILPPVYQATESAIDQVVADFVKATPHLGVIVTGHEVVLYDNVVFASPPAPNVLDSLTFTFHDGSSVSLVGTPAEISAAHWIH